MAAVSCSRRLPAAASRPRVPARRRLQVLRRPGPLPRGDADLLRLHRDLPADAAGHLDPRLHPARRARLAGGDPRLRARAVPDHRRPARPPGGPAGLGRPVSRSVALAALYGALGLGQALQNTQHVAWSVPRNSRPNPFYARLKTLVPAGHRRASRCSRSRSSSTVASTTDLFGEVLGTGLKSLLPLVTVLVVGTFLTLLFRYAATGQHSFRRAAPGGFALAVMWQVLQLGGAPYVDRVLVDTTSMTKTFGLVLGLIGFLWIGAVMAVLAMEINVVLARRLCPRALLTPFTDDVELTEADRRAYASYARMQRHKGFEKVSVPWDRAVGAREPEPGRRSPSPTPEDPRTSPRPAPGVTSYLTLARDATAEVEDRGSRFLCTLRRVADRGRRPRPGRRASARALGRPAPLLGLRPRPGRCGAALVRRRRAGRHRRGADARGAARGRRLSDVAAVVHALVRRHPARSRRPGAGLRRRRARPRWRRPAALRRSLLTELALDLDHADAGRVESELRARGVVVLDVAYDARVRLLLAAAPDEVEAARRAGRLRRPGGRPPGRPRSGSAGSTSPLTSPSDGVAVDVDPPPGPLLEPAHLVHRAALPAWRRTRRCRPSAATIRNPVHRVPGSGATSSGRVRGCQVRKRWSASPRDVGGVARAHQLLRRRRLRGVGEQRPAAGVVRRTGPARAGVWRGPRAQPRAANKRPWLAVVTV